MHLSDKLPTRIALQYKRTFLSTLFVLFLVATLLFAWSSFKSPIDSSPFTTPALRDMPILYQGRFRPMEAYSRLWLEERYGNPSIYRKDLASFPGSDGSALDVLWRWMLNQETLFQAPLFKIPSALQAAFKNGPTHLSYQELKEILQGSHLRSHFLWTLLLAHHAKELKVDSQPVELPLLAQGLFVKREKDMLQIVKVPLKGFSSHLQVGETFSLATIDPVQAQAFVDLLRVWAEPKEWKIVPPSIASGSWVNLSKAPEALRDAMRRAQEANNSQDITALKLAMQAFSSLQQARYATLAGKASLAASSVKLHYPTWGQLTAESLYVRLPGMLILLACYASGALLLTSFFVKGDRRLQKAGWFALGAGFLVHTLLLLTRCYILGRPPVSNMFETMLYVPWICMLVGFIAEYKLIGEKTLFAASCSAFLLLSLIPLTGMRGGMENVQAVLDSRYWLIIHVLMVVGSYGAFFVSGLLAHGFLLGAVFKKLSPKNVQDMKRAISMTLYVGVALLIPGTILGGVWAAQSWGRFWDWDPKESWACITSCIYLFVIHLYRFGRIQAIGLSFGSIVGLMAVSFTWYGVNYLLGVGLHSYGFGSGGESIYIAYLVAECLFLGLIAFNIKKQPTTTYTKTTYN